MRNKRKKDDDKFCCFPDSYKAKYSSDHDTPRGVDLPQIEQRDSLDSSDKHNFNCNRDIIKKVFLTQTEYLIREEIIQEIFKIINNNNLIFQTFKEIGLVNDFYDFLSEIVKNRLNEKTLIQDQLTRQYIIAIFLLIKNPPFLRNQVIDLTKLNYNTVEVIINILNLDIPKTKKDFLNELIAIAEDLNIEVLTTNYKDSWTPLNLKCKICGFTWRKKPKHIKDNYSSWKGCPKCRDIKRKKKFYNKYKLIADHRNIDVLSPLNEYENAKTPIKLKCRICDYKWSIAPENMKSSKSKKWGGCPSCRERTKWLERCPEDYNKKKLKMCRDIANKVRIDILSKEYINAHSEFQYQCRICHYIWFAKPSNSVLSEVWEGCPECKRIEYFNALRNVGMKKYSKLITNIQNYVDAISDLEWECLICGNHFFKSADLMKRRSNLGCPICYSNSTGYIREQFCRNMLEEILGVEFTAHKRFPWLIGTNKKPLHLDGYNSELRLAFEYNGGQHYFFVNYFHRTFSEFEDLQKNDEIKKNLCKLNKIHLIVIPYYIEFYEIECFIKEKLKSFVFDYSYSNINWKIILKKSRFDSYMISNGFRRLDIFID